MTALRRIEGQGFRAWIDEDFADSIAPMLEASPDGLSGLLRGTRPGALGRAQTHILELPGRSERIHLRSARRGGLLGALLPARVRGEARALAELELGRRLQAQGLPTVRPILVAGRRNGVFWDGLFGSLHAEGARSGLELLASQPSRATIRAAARASGSALRALHDAGVRHGDLHAGNLLFDARDRALLIDLDAAREFDATPAERMHELMRLIRSLIKRGLLAAAGPRGCAAFLSSYCDGDRALRRALLERRGREERRIALHRLAYFREEPRGQRI